MVAVVHVRLGDLIERALSAARFLAWLVLVQFFAAWSSSTFNVCRAWRLRLVDRLRFATLMRDLIRCVLRFFYHRLVSRCHDMMTIKFTLGASLLSILSCRMSTVYIGWSFRDEALALKVMSLWALGRICMEIFRALSAFFSYDMFLLEAHELCVSSWSFCRTKFFIQWLHYTWRLGNSSIDQVLWSVVCCMRFKHVIILNFSKCWIAFMNLSR